MGRTVLAEDNLLNALKNISKDSGFTFGLILGQSTPLKDYIVHFASCALPPSEANKNAALEGGDICSVKDLGDYDDSWIGSHTRNVIKMLPGGMTVLGVFVACAQSSSDTAVFNKLRTLAIYSYNSIKNNNYLHLVKNSDRLLLQYTLNNKTYVCKSIDAGSLNASLLPVDLKFTSEPLKWYSVDASVNLANFGPHFILKTKENYTLKRMLKEMLTVIQTKIEGCECSIDNKFVNMKDDLKAFKENEEKNIKELEKSTGKKLNFDSKSVQVQLYDRRLPEEFSFKVDRVEQAIEVNFKGDISSRVFITGSTTLEDTVKAVKEDLIRCCSSKFEMHWETNDDVINIKNGEKVNEEHVLPRRVLFTLPDSNIQFSEYLFLDESAEDVVPSIQENLGIQIDESSILDVLEAKCETASILPKSDDNLLHQSKPVADPRSNNFFIISMIIVSIIVLIISLFIQFA